MAEFETEKFIELIKNNPMLWDRGDWNYKNIKKKAAVWKKICTELGIGVELAKKKWKRLRNSYTREMNVREKRSSREIDPTSGWRFFEQLEFLKDSVKSRALLTYKYVDDEHNFGGGNSSSQEAGPSTSKEINFPILSAEVVFCPSPRTSTDEMDFSMSGNDSRRSQLSLREIDEGKSGTKRIKTEIALEETIMKTLDSLQSYLINKSDPLTTPPLATTATIIGTTEDELFCQSLIRLEKSNNALLAKVDMLRRQARLRREYLYKKTVESKQKALKDKKDLLKRSLERNIPIHGNLKRDAIQLHEKLKWNIEESNVDAQDDEYRFAGCEDPKIMITTSHNPSARLKMFVKELRLLFPNAQRMNRGKYEIKQLIHACRSNDVTDFIVVHEHRGVPDNLVICHLPHGPTAFFNLSGVVMRHDVPDVGPMSEQKPHLIFHNFKTPLANRSMNILKYLYPTPKEDSKRVMTFANHDDYICFRHHTFQYVNKELEMIEVGPRFQLKLYQIKLGTLDELQAADTEWVLRPYMNTAVKRRFLSDDDGWVQEDDGADAL